MKKEHKLIISLILMILAIFAVIGMTYAYFNATATSGVQVITTSNLNLRLETGNATHVTGIMPTHWPQTLEEANNNRNIVRIPFTISSTSRVTGNWSVNLKTTIIENTSLSGGSISDIKYRVYRPDGTFVNEGFFVRDFNEVIATGYMSALSNLEESFYLYIYIEETHTVQDSLSDIEFTVHFLGSAFQTD